MLTPAQQQILKNDINANPALASLPNNSDSSAFIADEYAKIAAPDFFVWRTNVRPAEIYHLTSPEATTWSWTTYKNQTIAEQNAWVQMFMGDEGNFALPNFRSGINAIFTGTGAAQAQREHCLAIGKRRANLGEKLLATGPGTQVVPATMTFQGEFSTDEIEIARSS